MRSKIERTIVFSIVACGIALAGCSSQKTQQQKFIDAMNHGNAAQANQIWLHMNASSREQFAHSQGMQPNIAPDELKKQVTQHYEEEMNGNGNDTGETVERPTPNVHLGGLESLPGYVGPSGQPPQSATVPTQDAPSN